MRGILCDVQASGLDQRTDIGSNADCVSLQCWLTVVAKIKMQ